MKRPPRARTSNAVRLDTYPPPYPDGWYRLMNTDDLRPGDLRYLECLGREIVVWRSEDGASLHAMTAFCPHQGANLAHGRVKGDRVVCPFHAWEMTGEGRVGCVPYSDNAPEKVLSETFPVRDVHGQVFMYHRSGGAPMTADEAPPYPPPYIPEVEEGRFVFRGHHDAGRVRMHIIEFAENSVDFAHFEPIHSQLRVPWTSIPVPGFTLEHIADWKIDEEMPYISYFLDTARVYAFGKPLERAGASAVAKFTGPGSVVNFHFFIPDLGEMELVQTHLPISPLEQQVDFHWFADESIPRAVAWYIVGNWVSQWKQDIEIWENKVYMQRPMLSKDDGPVHRMRRWYKQFYASHDDAAAPMAVHHHEGLAAAVATPRPGEAARASDATEAATAHPTPSVSTGGA
jgi:cholesterol 7-dehydrogenase